MNKGLVYIFTGDGKGKTSAALGVAMRAVGHGKRVAMIQWYKKSSKIKNQKSKVNTGGWIVGEHQIPELLKQLLFEIYPMGEGFHLAKSKVKSQKLKIKIAPLHGGGVVIDAASEEEHKLAAQEALQLAKELLEKESSPPLFLLVLDEVINAVNDGLLSLSDLLSLVKVRGSTHFILTGRGAPKKLIDIADLVTEMKNVKHPYEKGKKAIQGLDF